MGEAAREEPDIESRLSQLEADVADLPDLAEEWGDLDESPRATFSLEWYYSMVDTLVGLDRRYRAGQFSNNQSIRYRALLARLKELAPVIERLGFQQPTISLELVEAA